MKSVDYIIPFRTHTHTQIAVVEDYYPSQACPMCNALANCRYTNWI